MNQYNINQKQIYIIPVEHNKDSPYAKIGINNIREAMKNLKPTSFKLWIYFAKNQSNYRMFLSCVDACNFCNFSKNTFHSAVKDLIDAGYLKRTNENYFTFSEEI